MSDLQPYFCGKVEQRESSSVHALEWYWGSHVWVRKTVTRVFRFEGLSYANAHLTTAQTVTDVDGTQYTVPMEDGFVDSSTGTMVFETYSCQVVRQRVSPHLWRVVVTVNNSSYT